MGQAVSDGAPTVNRDHKIRQIEIEPERTVRAPGAPLRLPPKDFQKSNGDQGAVIQRKDPQNAPRVEIAKVVVRMSLIVEDACNQETRQNKEEIHPAPAEGHDRKDRRVEVEIRY